MHLLPRRRLSRATAAFALAVALAGGAGAVTAQPAAADDCYVQLDAPRRVKVDRPYKKVNVRLIDSCGIAAYAAFDLYGPRGFDNIFIFDGKDTDIWDVYDFHTLGTFESRVSGAWDSEYNTIPAREITTKVKLASKASIASSRSGSRVTLSVRATSYSPSGERFAAWNASKASIEYQTSEGWKTLKKVKLKGGKATYTFKRSSKRTYRFVVSENGSHWGATSGTTKR